MEGKITGMVIDQTRTEGKWYVREIRDENGGVRPLFFRREKADLIGRLIDKFTHAESAQRYAARHMEELGFDGTENVTDVYSAPGELKRSVNEQHKLTGERLQKLLNVKVHQAVAHPAAGAAIPDQDGSTSNSPPVTVICNKAQPKEQVDRLWNACQHRRYDDKQDKAARKDFAHLMGQALQLCSGELASNDPEVWRECRDFIRHLDAEGDRAWTDDIARQEFRQLRDHFFPAKAARAAAIRMDIDATAVEAGKMGFALERLIDAGKATARSGPGELRHSLEHMLQICLEEHASAQAMDAVFLPWPRITTARDPATLADLLDVAKALPKLRRNDDQAILQKTIATVSARLARIDQA